MHSNGVLHATTAFGKTVTAAAIIARKKVSTLILVHSKALLAQWHERLTEFLSIDYVESPVPKKRGRRKKFSAIGCLDSTGNSLHGIVDIALIQSCLDGDSVKPFVENYGMVIVDECHHVSSVTFENVLKSIKAHTVYGLTATPIRKDGHQPIIFMQCGPIRFSADAKSQIAKQSFERCLIPRFTSYRSITDDKRSITTLYQLLSEDEIRNSLIVEDVCKAVEAGRTPIILTNRTTHVTMLAEMLRDKVKNVVTLIGTGNAKEKLETLQHLHEISREERMGFEKLIKAFPFTITGMGEIKEAIITRGGVSVKEIFPSTMESRKVPGLYFVGEVLDLDAVTGGYNLQIAWSTAYAAAQAIR